MRKLYIFKVKDMYFSKEGFWCCCPEDALVVDDWAVEFYLKSKLKDYVGSVQLVEVEE